MFAHQVGSRTGFPRSAFGWRKAFIVRYSKNWFFQHCVHKKHTQWNLLEPEKLRKYLFSFVCGSVATCFGSLSRHTYMCIYIYIYILIAKKRFSPWGFEIKTIHVFGNIANCMTGFNWQVHLSHTRAKNENLCTSSSKTNWSVNTHTHTSWTQTSFTIPLLFLRCFSHKSLVWINHFCADLLEVVAGCTDRATAWPAHMIFCHLSREKRRVENSVQAWTIEDSQLFLDIKGHMHQIVVFGCEAKKTQSTVVAFSGTVVVFFWPQIQQSQWFQCICAIEKWVPHTEDKTQKVLDGLCAQKGISHDIIQGNVRALQKINQEKQQQTGVRTLKAALRVFVLRCPTQVFTGEMFYHWCLPDPPAKVTELTVSLLKSSWNAAPFLKVRAQQENNKNRI